MYSAARQNLEGWLTTYEKQPLFWCLGHRRRAMGKRLAGVKVRGVFKELGFKEKWESAKFRS